MVQIHRLLQYFALVVGTLSRGSDYKIVLSDGQQSQVDHDLAKSFVQLLVWCATGVDEGTTSDENLSVDKNI